MVKINRIIILTISLVLLVALAGVASASVTFTVDKIQRNGHYIGIPTLISGENHQYGYTYTFTPDGTYTVSGHVTNDANHSEHVGVGIRSVSDPEWFKWMDFYVPALGKSTWDYRVTSPDTNFESIVGIWLVTGEPLDFTGIKVEDVEDTTTHTIDQGPMSDATAIFMNGNMTYNGLPAFMVS